MRPFPAAALLLAAVALTEASIIHAQDAPSAEPRLVRTSLKLAPTERQLATFPRFPAEWWIAPNVAGELGGVLTAWKFSPAMVARLRQAAVPQADGSALIVPEIAWLDEFTPAERTRWLVLLGLHRQNVTFRWPLAVPNTVLDQLEAREEFAEAVQRIRRWGLAAGTHTVFGDLWALEGAVAGAAARREFLREAVGGDSLLLKLQQPESADEIAAEAAYWQANGRYRAIEPFYSAVLRVKDHARIDLAHFLPRFARSVLFTYPPGYDAGRDLAVECGTLAASFFTTTPENPTALEDGFATWLRRECVAITDAPRFGDILVFEDPSRVRWPYAAVYIANGLVFARRPALFGPWQFLEPREITRLNPRLGASPTTIYRRRSSLRSTAAPFRLRSLPESWRQPTPLRLGKPGPWGRIASYELMLAPSGDLLENLPKPAGAPVWDLLLPEREPLIRDLELMEMPPALRRELVQLLRGAPAPEGPVLTVRPSLDLVLKVPGPVRARLFRHLIPGTTSDAYAQTIQIASRVPADQWFSREALPEPTRSAVLGLTYPAGRSFALSDYGALFEILPTEKDARLSAMRAIFSSPALIVILEKPAPGDVATIAQYWQTEQQKDLGAVLGSLSQDDSSRYLDIVHLLPPLAREFLNLYAFVAVGSPAASCYWSALNFDVDEPDARLQTLAAEFGAEARLAWEKLQAEFDPIAEPGALGDIIAYREKTGRRELTHVCSFIADDIVFTKNGHGLMAPWCLMRLDDVDSVYLDAGIERRYFRRKARGK